MEHPNAQSFIQFSLFTSTLSSSINKLLLTFDLAEVYFTDHKENAHTPLQQS